MGLKSLFNKEIDEIWKLMKVSELRGARNYSYLNTWLDFPKQVKFEFYKTQIWILEVKLGFKEKSGGIFEISASETPILMIFPFH